MVTAWRGVLGLDRSVKIHDDSDFFELGGDLVSAAVLASMFEMRLSVEEVIDECELAQMVRCLGRKRE